MANLISPSARALSIVQQDISDLEQMWSLWRARYLYWMSKSFPGNPMGQILTGIGTIFQTESVQELEDRRSRFISEWIGTRGQALTDIRTSAKTNVLSATFGEESKDQLADEGLVELATGIFNMLRKQKIQGMGGFSWDYALKMMGTWTGKEAFMVRVYKDRHGHAKVEAPFIDPYNLFHDIDTQEGDEHRVVRRFEVKWRDLPGEMARWTRGRADALPSPPKPGDKKDDDYAVVSDYWRRDPDGKIWHSMLVDGGADSQGNRRFHPIRESVVWDDHGYGKLPIVVGSRPAANHGFQDAKHSGMTVKDAKAYYHAEPFYARAINLVIFQEGLESLAADGAALAALPIFLRWKGDGGDESRKPEIKPFAMLEMATDEQLRILDGISQGRFTVDNALERIDRQLSSVFPDLLLSTGQVANVSGYSITSQISQAKKYMVPWTRMDEAAKTELLRCAFDQHQNVYSDLDFRVTGILPETGKFGRVFKAADYPKDFDIDLQEPAEIPGEAQQKMALARALTEGDRPLASIWTARVDVGIGQPHREQQRIDDERFHNSPENQNMEMVDRLVEKVKARRAERDRLDAGSSEWLDAAIALVDAEDFLNAKRQQLMGAPQTGFTMPREPGNPSPENMPPQMGVDDPNMAALAENRSPSGTGGRPRARGVR